MREGRQLTDRSSCVATDPQVGAADQRQNCLMSSVMVGAEWEQGRPSESSADYTPEIAELTSRARDRGVAERGDPNQ